jgi:hypothetical protein
VTNCTITGSGANGVDTEGDGYFVAFSNNTITECEGYPVYFYSNISAAKNFATAGGGNSFTGNDTGKDYLYVNDSSSPGIDFTITKENVPWYFVNGFSFGTEQTTLTVQPGATIVMGANEHISIGSTASLNAVGTASEHITIRGYANAEAQWNGLKIYTTSTAPNQKSVLSYVDISGGGYGKNYYDGSNLYLEGNVKIDLANVNFTQTGYCHIGLSVETTAVITDNGGITFEVTPSNGTVSGTPYNVWDFNSNTQSAVNPRVSL